MLVAWRVNECDTVAAHTPMKALDFIVELTETAPEENYAIENIGQANYDLNVKSTDEDIPTLTIGQIMKLLNELGVREPVFICSTEY